MKLNPRRVLVDNVHTRNDACCLTDRGNGNVELEELRRHCQVSRIRVCGPCSHETFWACAADKQGKAHARSVGMLIIPGWLPCHFVRCDCSDQVSAFVYTEQALREILPAQISRGKPSYTGGRLHYVPVLLLLSTPPSALLTHWLQLHSQLLQLAPFQCSFCECGCLGKRFFAYYMSSSMEINMLGNLRVAKIDLVYH